MSNTDVTRRRVLAGAGAIGLASVGPAVTGARGQDDGDDETAAIRVAHGSPDAPDVDVRFESQDGAADETGGETGDGQDGDGDDEGFTVEALGFREVSSYSEVDPGTYQVQIETTEEGLFDGLFDDFFDEGEEGAVFFDDTVEIEAGTTYTVVAFGEVGQGPVPAEEDEAEDGMGENGTNGGDDEADAGGTDDGDDDATGEDERVIEELEFGEHERIELDAGDHALEFHRVDTDEANGEAAADATDGNETGGGGDDDETGEEGAGGADGSGRGFQVTVLEDDLTDPGEDAARVRVFHAVPDVGPLNVSPAFDPDDPEDEAIEDEGLEDDEIAVDRDDDTVGVPSRQAQISPDGGTGYSGFAVGYFDPEAADFDDDGSGDGEGTDGGDGTGGDATDGDEAETDEVGREDFTFVTVQDAQGGERADGGTDDAVLTGTAPPVSR